MRDNVRYELRGQNLYCIDLNMNSDGGPAGGCSVEGRPETRVDGRAVLKGVCES